MQICILSSAIRQEAENKIKLRERLKSYGGENQR
jgi:hypothetical protein